MTVRPLLNLFFPLLSGVVQPLAGEYAGRREVLEQLPFFSGYGVETGLLVDLLERYGLYSIGQVNLEKRVHRNRPLADLSLTAFAIVQVILTRLQDRARITLLEEVNRSMKLIHFDHDHLSLEVKQVQDVERPPMVSMRNPENQDWLRRRSMPDTEWYKDVVIYELPVKAFFDANNDGYGDFAGLTQKLDYLQYLGVDCIWLLPFYGRRCAMTVMIFLIFTRYVLSLVLSRTSRIS